MNQYFWKLIIAGVIVTFLGIIFLSSLKNVNPNWNWNNWKKTSKSSSQFSDRETLSKVKNRLLTISKQLAKAHRFARSSKTLLELDKESFMNYVIQNEAFETVSQTLEELLNTEPTGRDRNQFLFPKENCTPNGTDGYEVCPESWLWTGAWYPFDKGYVTNCTGLNVKPFQILTILVNFVSEASLADWNMIAEGFSKTDYRNLTIVAGVEEANREQFEKVAEKYLLRTEIVTLDATWTLGKSLSKMLESVHTKYVLVTRDLARFDEFSRLERLVRLLSYIDADFVSGSHRNSTGHWELGCYQMAVKNYTMRLVEGYDLSYNSCIYCDYISGPFAVRTQTLKSLIDDSMNGEPFYANLWLKARDSRVILNCPDAMFHSREIGLSLEDRSHWLPLAKKHELNRLIFPDPVEFTFSCGDIGVACSTPKKGLANHICCHEELTHLLVSTATILDQHGIQYELDSGTMLGGIKLGGTLPWELDHDFIVNSHNMSVVSKLGDEFKKVGLRLSVGHYGAYPACLQKEQANDCGYIQIRSKSYFLELFGTIPLANHVWKGQIPVTKAKVVGRWMNIYPSPVFVTRNKFTDDMFKHVEHPTVLGKKHVKAGVFSPCPRPGFHGCLKGNYLPVGNLQFKDIWI